MKKAIKNGLVFLAIVGMLFSTFAVAAAQLQSSSTNTGLDSTRSQGTSSSLTGTQTAGDFSITAPATSSTTNSQQGRPYISSITTVSNLAPSSSAGAKPAIILSEVNSRGDEHVSLFNAGDEKTNLDGFRLDITDGSSFTLPAFTLLPGEEVAIFFGEGTSSQDALFAGLSYPNVLNDESGLLSLEDNTGSQVSSTTYTSNSYWKAPAAPAFPGAPATSDVTTATPPSRPIAAPTNP